MCIRDRFLAAELLPGWIAMGAWHESRPEDGAAMGVVPNGVWPASGSHASGRSLSDGFAEYGRRLRKSSVARPSERSGSQKWRAAGAIVGTAVPATYVWPQRTGKRPARIRLG